MTAAWSARAFWTCAALGAVSLGAAAGPVAWRITGADGRALPETGRPQAPADIPRVDLSPILAFAPFGRAVAAAPAPQIAGETTLGLRLLGVTIASAEAGSRAIIEAPGEPAEIYGIGAEVAPDVLLIDVAEDHIVLRVADRLETLSFAVGGAATARSATGGPDLRNLIPGTAAKAAPTEAPDAVIARYRAAIDQNVQGVLDRLGLVPTDRGYLIADAAPSDVRQAGFRPGDLVTTVNGKAVGNVEADRAWFDEIAASGRARVELMRDGQVIVMSFPLR